MKVTKIFVQHRCLGPGMPQQILSPEFFRARGSECESTLDLKTLTRAYLRAEAKVTIVSFEDDEEAGTSTVEVEP